MFRIITATLISFALLSCSKDAKEEIKAIVWEDSGLDLSKFQFSIMKDTSYRTGNFSLIYHRSATLLFDSTCFEQLKDTIRATPFFNAITITDGPTPPHWATKAPGAVLGLWQEWTDQFHYAHRTDSLRVPGKEHYYVFTDINFQTRTMEIDLSDYRRYQLFLRDPSED